MQKYEFHDRLAARLAERDAQPTPGRRPRRGNGGGRAILLLIAIALGLAALAPLVARLGPGTLSATDPAVTAVEDAATTLAAAPAEAGLPDAERLGEALYTWARAHVGPSIEVLDPMQFLVAAGTGLLFVVIFSLLMLRLVLRLVFGRRQHNIKEMGIR
ncbi:hypothetical protein [Pseudoroseicyclus tamaricis]|uniref:Uncharacterized protein n=2 Tax=Pseudoroseicyclus tamaricis TaxID=2705421 RepID=A0A6B2K0U1_9RHOB|nr:hypothetical protein [Pseudoroseicyclus tamaricis]NDV02054.1 hypothetical protein [Pseudoroseicyclus tamaricis]